ncbi:MAG: hypothetical protein R3F53_22435 [Gammaproteobacteria bacterium]
MAPAGTDEFVTGRIQAWLEPGGLGEFMRGEMYHEAKQHFDQAKLKGGLALTSMIEVLNADD